MTQEQVKEMYKNNPYAVEQPSKVGYIAHFTDFIQAKEYCKKHKGNFIISKYNEEKDTFEFVENKIDKREITLFVEKLLRKSISDDYTGTIVNEIIEDVILDIETIADIEYNESDVKLAIGRVLLERMGLE